MRIDVSKSNVMEVYHALVGIVAPRPIAWVTTVDSHGRVNLAPYSFFNVFGANPPVVVFSPSVKRDGSPKDTLRNVEETGEFVVNGSTEAVAEALNLTSLELPHGESEAERAGLTLVPSEMVRPPRVAESLTHLECKLHQVVSIGHDVGAANLVIGEVVLIHVDDSILDDRGRIDPMRLRAISRLGGDWYGRTVDLFEMGRPRP